MDDLPFPEEFDDVVDVVFKSDYRKRLTQQTHTLRKRAITMIGVKLWSVPDEKLELWLELLSYFEQ
jgi:hypothetical protein